MSYEYRESDHSYWMHGQMIPSVTQALKSAGLIDTSFYTPEACARGTAVHAACEYADIQTPQGIVDFKVETWPYLKAYGAFLNQYRPVFSAIEVGLFHPHLRFGGRPDRVCSDLLGRPAILEIKTGDEEPWHGYQTAGYQLLVPTGARWVLYLRPNGTFKLKLMKEAQDYAVFLDALKRAA